MTVIEFADPGYNWGWFFGSIALVAVLAGLATLGITKARGDATGDWAQLAIGSILCGLLFGWLPAAVGGHTQYSQDVHTAKTVALKEIGYSHVDLGDDLFTASRDGRYVLGVLVDNQPTSDYSYTVLELKE